MLRNLFDELAIGFLVTVMTSNTDLKYLTQEQIDKVCEGVGLKLYDRKLVSLSVVVPSRWASTRLCRR